MRLTLCLLTLSFLLGCTRKEVIETYPEGQPKRAEVYTRFGAKDSTHLRKRIAYYLNGKTEYEVSFLHGVRHGEYKAYWHNGQLQSKGNYREGNREGLWEFYHNRFTLASKGDYVRDQPEGLWTQYWEDGELKQRGDFHRGRETGEWMGWNQRGVEVLKNSCFEANARGNTLALHENGAVKEKFECRYGRRIGRYERFDPNGTLIERGFYDTAGIKDSLWETFHPSGHRASRQVFRNGFWNDSVLAWSDSGRSIQRGFFQAGTGGLVRFDSLGRLAEKETRLEGQKDGEHWKYYPHGQKRSLTRYQKGVALSMQRWHANGVLAAEGAFVSGKKSGVWKDWDDQKRLRETAIYENGELHGERRFYDSTHTLTRLQKYFRGIPTEGSFPGIPGGIRAKGAR